MAEPLSRSARLARLVREAPTPLVRIGCWPWGGADGDQPAIRDALVDRLDARPLRLAEPEDPRRAARAIDASDPEAVFLVWSTTLEGRVPLATLGAVLEAFGPGQVLIVLEPGTRPLGALPATSIEPRIVCYQQPEVRTLLEDRLGSTSPGMPAVGALALTIFERTGGWPGPVEWSIDRLATVRSPDGLSRLFEGEAFRDALRRRVLDAADDSAIVDLLLDLANAASDAAPNVEPSAQTFVPTSRPSLELHLLGPPVARRRTADGDTRELAWRLRKALQVVAYLALAPSRRASKDDLIAAVWPDADPGAVRRNFHPTISDARRTLVGRRAGGIVHSQGLYGLDPSLDWTVDVVSMTEAAARGAADRGASSTLDDEAALEALRRAWSLYRGPFLDGFDAPWILERRAAIRRVHLDVLRRCGDLAQRLGYDTLALDAYRSLLIEEPFEEHVHLEVMELYARLGRRDLVRRQYLRLQDLLDELHVEPGESTRDRYHQLMA